MLDSALLTGWARAATEALERHCAEVDRINVFPVADGDTGTNLLLTMRAALDAACRVPPGDGTSAVATALARGALLGARGNSGVILSQVLRGMAEAVAAARAPLDGAVLSDALARARALAVAAFDHPREGTVLTVLAEAAEAARGSRLLDRVASAAADGAALALRATTGQLPELARAGVVDAGGLGLYLVLDALDGLLNGHPSASVLPVAPEPAVDAAVAARGSEALRAEREAGSEEFEYEVMYLLDADAAAVAVLRVTLAALGDCVAVVGDGDGLWNVHVHCTDVGAAIEAGVAAGRPHRITVIRFADQTGPDATPGRADRFVRSRAVLMVVTGAEVAELARSAGASVIERESGESIEEAELVAALAGTLAQQVVLLPDDSELTAVAERAAAVARREGQEVLVVPTASVLQGLAALAVHDPNRRPGDDVVAMAEAAALTRTAGLMVAESEALTWVGRCEPGDVLGVADGEVVLIAPDLAVGALWLAHRMLLAGGEIVTALLGQGADEDLGEGLAADLRRTHPEVDVVVHRGGQTDYPLVLGVE
ncbi:MAG: domain fusion protein YloV [Pseudonocardia sp.]|nr:domain fusion protein YloV [Pseudonocardia sp.]MDT7614385.1 fatty acid kinase [Pseudonocardiales bacterium]